MTTKQWIDRRAKDLQPSEIEEQKRLRVQDFAANSRNYWIRGSGARFRNEYSLIPNIGLAVGRSCNYKARLYGVYGLKQTTIRVSVCFLKIDREWTFTYARLHPKMIADIADGVAL
jgi:hypothetical protein